MKIKDFLPAVIVILLALSLSITAICYAAHERKNTLKQMEPQSFQTPEQLPEEIFPTETETTTEATTAEPTTEAATTEPEFHSVPADDSRIYLTSYRFSKVDTSYFDDAVFIGNSRLQGFILYSKVPDLCAYTYVGMSVKSYFTKAEFTVNGMAMTAAEALENTPGFTKVYLKLGINELGWVSTEQFIEEYSKILEHIYSCNPNAIIFVHSLLPVSEAALEKDHTLSKEKIIEYNDAIQKMAAKYGACYLDVGSIFTAEDGYMPYEYSFDGVHLNVDSIQLWLNYLLEHGIEVTN